jgi:hypothetical protein
MYSIFGRITRRRLKCWTNGLVGSIQDWKYLQKTISYISCVHIQKKTNGYISWVQTYYESWSGITRGNNIRFKLNIEFKLKLKDYCTVMLLFSKPGIDRHSPLTLASLI